MKPNKERIELLCRELESTKVQQCGGRLRVPHSELTATGKVIKHPDMMCVWGIATELALQHGVETEAHPWCSSVPQPEIVEWFFGPGVSYTDVEITLELEDHPRPVTEHLLDWNDVHLLPFWDMAQGLRAKYLKDEDA